MSITLPKLDPIDFLVLRKFPDAEQIETAYYNLPAITPIERSTGIKRKIDPIEQRYEPIQDYRKELAAKSPEELDAFFIQEQAKFEEEQRVKAEKEEQWRFWNQPCALADFDHWSKAIYWTLEEAIALSFGKDPNAVNWDRLKNINVYPASPFIEQYSKIRDLVLRAKAWEQLYDPALPGFYIAWAKRLEIDFPKELEEKVIARGGVVADWKTTHDILQKNYDALNTQYEEYSAKTSEVLIERFKKIQDLQGINGLLQERLQELTDQANAPKEKPLKATERNTLLKMAFGMAKAWYGYDPGKARSNSVADIRSDLERSGAPMDDETIRKYLRLGAELFPETVEES